MSTLGELSERTARRFTDIDPVRHVALLAYATHAVSQSAVGEAGYILSADEAGSAEFARAGAPDWQGLGLARVLLARLSGRAAAAGVRRLVVDTLAGKAAMLELARAAGFTVSGNGVDRRLLRLVKEPKGATPAIAAFRSAGTAELHCSQGG